MKNRVYTYIKERYVQFAFLLILLVGIYFRLYQLGYAAMRGDTINFWLGGIDKAVPFSMAVTKWFVFTFDLMESTFAKRFPSAVWGILCIPAAYSLGRILSGKHFGLLLATLVALNPFCIQCSREAYFYAPLTLGAIVAVAATAEMYNYCWGRKPFRKQMIFMQMLGFFLLTCVHPPGWPTAVMLGLVNLSFLRSKTKQGRKLDGNDLMLLLVYLIIASVVAFSAWGPFGLIQVVLSGQSTTVKSTFSESGSSLQLLYYSLVNLSWGWTPLRLGFTIFVVVVGIIVCLRRAQTNPLYWFIIDLVLFGTTIQIFARKITLSPYEVRYLLPVFPAFLVVQGIGLLGLSELLRKDNRIVRGIQIAIVFLAIVLWLPPDHQVTLLNGYVKPYNDIVDWVDSHLRPDTLVLVDRFYEVNNELYIYNSTNITFTYTVPNEPVEAYIRNHWRETVKGFFQRFPQAAFLEIRKSYWEHPAVGPWHWPAEFFRQHVTFTNAAALKLRTWGLGSRVDYYSEYADGMIVELYYDTREDIIDKARAAGETCLALYGRGWRYMKPWVAVNDYSDWRVLEDWAEIDLYNLTSSNLEVAVYINGAAVEKDKRVKLSNGSTFNFKEEKQMDVLTRAIDIPPGLTTVTLTDPLWKFYNVPLLVAQIDCRIVSSTNVADGTTITIAPAPGHPQADSHKVNYTIPTDN